MNKSIKNCVYIFFVVLIFGNPLKLFALEEKKINIELPSIGINDIILKEYNFTPGKNISTTIYIENLSNSPSEFYYKTELYSANMSNESNAQLLLGSSELSEMKILSPKEQGTIILNPLIPSFTEGDILFSVVFYNNAGILIGRREIYLINENSQSSILLDSKNNNPEIKKITFLQDGVEFEPLLGNNAVLVSMKSDLAVSVEVATKEDSLVAVNFKNKHDAFASTTIYQSTETRNNTKVAFFVVDKNSLVPGLYTVDITPINIRKEQIGVSKRVNIGVEGLAGVVHAFNLEKINDNRVKLLVNWAPLTEISNLLSSSTLELKFDAVLTLFDNSKQVIATTSISNVDTVFDTEVLIPPLAEDIWGNVKIFYKGTHIASYEKKLFVQDVNIVERHNFNLSFIVIIFMSMLILTFYFFKKKRKINGIVVLLVLSFIFPNITTAQWTLKSQGSFDNNYPKGDDASLTQWGFPGYPWLGTTRAHSLACSKKTSTSGSTSNYVTQSLPVISSDQKMYPWENSWYHINKGGWDWYQLNKAKNGVWPNLPTTIPEVFSNTSFMHANQLAKTAKLTDNLNNLSGYIDRWSRRRPFRISTTNGMGTNTTFALSTSTFSNIFNWFSVNFNAAQSVSNNFQRNSTGRGVVAESPLDLYGLFFGLSTANHIDQYAPSGYATGNFLPSSSYSWTFPNNLNNLLSLRNSIPVGTSTVSYWLDAAGRSTYLDYFAGDYRFIDSSDIPSLNSRPGTYKLFNFLTTYRDETNGAAVSGSAQIYDCISVNQQIYETNYEIVPNSYIEVVLFYDVNENGILDANEKKIANFESNQGDLQRQVGIDGGWMLRDNFPASNRYCPVPSINSRALNGVESFQATSTNPIAVLLSSASDDGNQNDDGVNDFDDGWSDFHNKSKMAGAYVRTQAQVLNTLHSPNLSSATRVFARPAGGILDTRYFISSYEASTYTNTPSPWVIGSGYGRSSLLDQAFYDSAGRLVMLSGTSACGQSIIGNDAGIELGMIGGYFVLNPYGYGEDINYLHKTEVLDFPIPNSVANATTPYFKFPVNWALTRFYEVGVDTNLLPAGWSTTTNPVIVDLGATSTSAANNHYPVYLGIKYTGNGVCGSAITTPSGSPVTTAPSSSLCSAGSSTAVVSNGQGFTWSCNGYGTGSTASCTKPVCGGTNSYYCAVTNSCVASAGACQIAGVCGSATTQPGRSTAGLPTQPSTSLCSAGTQSAVAGQSDPVSQYTWTCAGISGGVSSPTCSQSKCSSAAGLQYCSAVNECRSSCPVTSTSTLIFDAKLTPRVVRKSTDQCIFSWKTSSSADLPVSCTLNGVPLGGALPTIQRNVPVSVGSHTLSCTNTEQDQSTTTKCLLNPSYKEI